MNTTTPVSYDVAGALRARRKALGMTQSQVTNRTTIENPNALGSLENGSQASHLLGRLDEFAQALDWTIEQLLAAARGGAA
jgi:transcriptional regulator with XRE-family HTH domain